MAGAGSLDARSIRSHLEFAALAFPSTQKWGVGSPRFPCQLAFSCVVTQELTFPCVLSASFAQALEILRDAAHGWDRSRLIVFRAGVLFGPGYPR